MLESNIRGGEPVCGPEDVLFRLPPTRYERYKEKFGITADLSTDEKRIKTSALFLILANAAARILDNCDDPTKRDKRIEKSNIGSGVEATARSFALCGIQVNAAVKLVAECAQDIDSAPEAHTDGMSLCFEECASIVHILQKRIHKGEDTIEETANLAEPRRIFGECVLSVLVFWVSVVPIDMIGI